MTERTPRAPHDTCWSMGFRLAMSPSAQERLATGTAPFPAVASRPARLSPLSLQCPVSVARPRPCVEGLWEPLPILFHGLQGTEVPRSALIRRSQDGRWLAAPNEKGLVDLWDLSAAGAPVRMLLADIPWSSSLLFSTDNKRLMAWRDDLFLVDLETLQARRLHHRPVELLALAPDARNVLAEARDWRLFLWDCDGQVPVRLVYTSPAEEIIRSSGPGRFSDRSNLLFLQSGKDAGVVFKTATGDRLWAIEGPSHSGQFSDDENLLLVTQRAAMWPRAWLQRLDGAKAQQEPVRDVGTGGNLRPDGATLARTVMAGIELVDTASERRVLLPESKFDSQAGLSYDRKYRLLRDRRGNAAQLQGAPRVNPVPQSPGTWDGPGQPVRNRVPGRSGEARSLVD